MIAILIATALVFAISGTFAALLLVAERYLVNYGQCEIDINASQRTLSVKGGESLLSSLMAEGVFVPSACGGRGTCAYCKVKVVDGAGPLAPTEAPLLSEDEIRDNVRISCQVKVRNDIRIEIPPELFAIKRFVGTVEAMRDLTHDIKQLRIALTDPPEIDFVPGQYIQLEVPSYGGGRGEVYRAYSMSNPPSDARHVETIIRLVPSGICTTWVFEHLKVGDAVALTGPYGEFRLSDSAREMVWIAGGSGMAPFWSILRHMAENDIRRKCTYFFGAVAARDLFYIDELRRLADELDWFTFIPALSSPAVEDNWAGEQGLITDVVARHVSDGADMEGYLCGSPGMIDASIKVLHEKSITDDRIFYDKFA